jgi:hypothetical protein
MKEKIETILDKEMTERDECLMLIATIIVVGTAFLLSVVSFYLLVLRSI